MAKAGGVARIAALLPSSQDIEDQAPILMRIRPATIQCLLAIGSE
jgi:hypothetical protein